MMYKKNFAAAIKVNGKILREHNDIVSLPFGSEYSIYLKNLNSVRAQVRVSIDGAEVSNGWLVIAPNSTLDLERFIKNTNSKSGNRFKFIERSKAIENHRGIKVDDGLVRIEYKFEKYIDYQTWNNSNSNPIYPTPIWNPNAPKPYPWGGTICRNANGLFDHQVNSDSLIFANNMNFATETAMIRSCAGITVEGTKSNQAFVETSDFECDSSEVIVIQMTGKINDKSVLTPITVDQKPSCKTCGKTNKATNKFCSECGTSLISY